ncbi:MAG: hypothetical protein KGL39_48950 [Patescibacteria group bacterium]|nr:hypothetical protein [Patescibacteria group bacterium]
MDIQTFLAIGIVGVVCSLIVEAITRYFSTKPLTSKLVSAVTCLVIGTGFYFASHATWWATVLGVLAAASTVYAFVFNSNGPSSAQG